MDKVHRRRVRMRPGEAGDVALGNRVQLGRHLDADDLVGRVPGRVHDHEPLAGPDIQQGEGGHPATEPARNCGKGLSELGKGAGLVVDRVRGQRVGHIPHRPDRQPANRVRPVAGVEGSCLPRGEPCSPEGRADERRDGGLECCGAQPCANIFSLATAARHGPLRAAARVGRRPAVTPHATPLPSTAARGRATSPRTSRIQGNVDRRRRVPEGTWHEGEDCGNLGVGQGPERRHHRLPFLTVEHDSRHDAGAASHERRADQRRGQAFATAPVWLVAGDAQPYRSNLLAALEPLLLLGSGRRAVSALRGLPGRCPCRRGVARRPRQSRRLHERGQAGAAAAAFSASRRSVRTPKLSVPSADSIAAREREPLLDRPSRVRDSRPEIGHRRGVTATRDGAGEQPSASPEAPGRASSPPAPCARCR